MSSTPSPIPGMRPTCGSRSGSWRRECRSATTRRQRLSTTCRFLDLADMGGEEWTVAAHLHGCDPAVIRLYDRFVELVEACGEFEVAVSKTAISFKGTRRGFAGAKPKKRWLDGYLDLQRQLTDPRIRSASPYTKRLFVHQFRVTGARSARRRLRRMGTRGIRRGTGTSSRIHLERPSIGQPPSGRKSLACPSVRERPLKK